MSHDWASQSLRQMVIQQIEDTSRKFGNISVKTSQEYEQHILDKAQSRDDYLQMVARLILHIKEVRGKGGQIQTGTSNQNLSNTNVGGMNQMVNVINQGTNLIQQQQPQPTQQQHQMNAIMQQSQIPNLRTNAMNQQNQQIQQMNTNNRSNEISQNLVAGQSMQVTLQGNQIISQRGTGVIPHPQLQQQQSQAVPNTSSFISQISNITNSSTSGGISGPSQLSIGVQQPQQLQQQQQSGMMQKTSDQQMKAIQHQQFAKQILIQRNQQQQLQQQQQNTTGNNINLQNMQNISQTFNINGSKVPLVPPVPPQQSNKIGQQPCVKSMTAPSPQAQQLQTASPQMVSPAQYINPPSIGPSASPLTQADEIMYTDKFKEMSKYIDPLKRLIKQMPITEDLKKEHAKMNGLLEVIMNKNRRVQMNVLNQCENVLRKLFPDVASNVPIGTPDPNVIEHSNIPTPAKPTLQPMGEVVTNIITNANLMSQTRQNILPGMFALNAPMIRPPPPLPKSRKRSYEDLDPSFGQNRSELPHALQMEIVHLLQNFSIKIDTSQSVDKSGVTLICESKHCSIPSSICSVSVRIPGNYPKTEPGFCLRDFGNSLKVSEVRDHMSKKLMRLPYTMTFSSILKAWEQSLLE